ncbi:hypothetical protein M3Y99_00295700 [Aphelenchoides fujianensis]|nr:hypothetical protein M3Y99_00295700 [Aphelenchoides fujianensis]
MDLIDGSLQSKEWAKAEEKFAAVKQKSARLIAAIGRKVENGIPVDYLWQIVFCLVYRTYLDALNCSV